MYSVFLLTAKTSKVAFAHSSFSSWLGLKYTPCQALDQLLCIEKSANLAKLQGMISIKFANFPHRTVAILRQKYKACRKNIQPALLVSKILWPTYQPRGLSRIASGNKSFCSDLPMACPPKQVGTLCKARDYLLTTHIMMLEAIQQPHKS